MLKTMNFVVKMMDFVFKMVFSMKTDRMRLHFWAMRETGIVEQSPSFAEYYVKFIAHFVSVYERSAP